MGETVAELGNRNRPLDMVVYDKDGHDHLLMAHNARGLMKISLKEVATIEPITKPISDKAGLEYETIGGMNGVVQLDRLNDDSAVILVQTEDGGQNLDTIVLP